MAFKNRKGGIITLRVDGTAYYAKGNFTYNLGKPKRQSIEGYGPDGGAQGYKEVFQSCFIEGEITDDHELDLANLAQIDGATVTLDLANGKTIVLHDAWYSQDGTGNSEDGKIAVRFEGKWAEEIH